MIEILSDELRQMRPRLAVVGVGGAGGNAVATMMANAVGGVEFAVINTDAQALNGSSAATKVQLGPLATGGLGAGSRARVGEAAAEESLIEIERLLAGVHMCFIAAGMGGGTGSGAAPILARAARSRGILTVAVVTKPFAFEGRRRAAVAEAGIAALVEHVDTLIVIPNQNLFRISDPSTSFRDAFAMADDLLMKAVRGISDLIAAPGLINLDFADLHTAMAGMGRSMIGFGEAEGQGRALAAARQAVENPLVDEMIAGAAGLVVSITGGETLRLMELEEAASYIKDMVDPEADIIWGSSIDPKLGDRIRVAVIATGIGVVGQAKPESATVPPPFLPVTDTASQSWELTPIAPFVHARLATPPEGRIIKAQEAPATGGPSWTSCREKIEVAEDRQGESLLRTADSVRPSLVRAQRSLVRGCTSDNRWEHRGPSLFERVAALTRQPVGPRSGTISPTSPARKPDDRAHYGHAALPLAPLQV